jgi:hypothetical protein
MPITYRIINLRKLCTHTTSRYYNGLFRMDRITLAETLLNSPTYDTY